MAGRGGAGRDAGKDETLMPSGSHPGLQLLFNIFFSSKMDANAVAGIPNKRVICIYEEAVSTYFMENTCNNFPIV